VFERPPVLPARAKTPVAVLYAPSKLLESDRAPVAVLLLPMVSLESD
jgi:hypothetical protein